MLVLIAGITGNLGQRLAKVALSRGLSVRGLGRSPDNLSPELSSQIESFIKSSSYYDIPALEKAVTGVDAVINAYAPTPMLDLDGHLLLIRAAERAGIKIFIASSWSRDWTNIKFGDFEHYNNHIAFQHQVATTSSIRPVYILSGIFADLLFTQYGPGGFNTTGERPVMQYWGDNGKSDKWPWTTQEDVTEWTIDILLHGEGVQAGNGGFFKTRSGVTTIEELAAVYAKAFGKTVDIVRAGSVEDLEAKLAKLRKDNPTGPGYFGWMSEAAALVASKGLWENSNVTMLDQFKKPTSLVQYFSETKI
jgi:nucleoside-diphosphate-sugar epimerase